MKLKNLTAYAFICFAAILFSCKKDLNTPDTTPVDEQHFPIPSASPVTGKLTGIVVNESNQPVQNADVILNGTTYQTDINGLFQTNNVVLDKYITTVTVNKTGYFKALRSFSATASINYISIKLIPKTLSGTVDAGAGGTVSLNNGTSITLQSNGIVVKSTGAAYTGAVKVYAAYIDPTSSDFADIVPGSMMARDNNNMYVLQSTGMVAVDLESDSGQPLQLASNKTASLKLPIPASLTGKAPASIDTWSLNDQGIWVKEGTATKNGDFYELQVSHFSFWNCDVPANAVYLTIHVTDQNNQPLPNALVQLTIPNNNTWWATTYGHTDSTGTVAGLVPANLGLVMNLFNNTYNCSNAIATQNIGPFGSDTTINVSVTINTSQYVTISGILNDCNGQPVQNGTASLLVGSYNYYTVPVVNGNYSISVPFCNNPSTVSIWLVDSNTGAYANPVTVTITGTNINVPTQVACGSSPNALFTLNGCQIFGDYTAGIGLTSANYIAVLVNVMAPGTYNISSDPVNGIQFAGSGTITQTGADTLYLPAVGTPAGNGSFNVNTNAGNGQTCTTVLTVGGPVPYAIFSLGGPGNCPNLTVAGNYVVNYPLNQTNFVVLTVDVVSPGIYSITTGLINGMTFSGSGVFTTTGVLTVSLTGTGTPLTANTSTFIAQANGINGCTFDVVTTNTGAADYTFEGAPNACAGATIAGTYLAGIPLIGQNTVAIQVVVTTGGAYSIMTNTVNGFSFSGSGFFSTLGLQTVLLTASGTPIAAGNDVFTPSGGSSPGCVFTVTTN